MWNWETSKEAIAISQTSDDRVLNQHGDTGDGEKWVGGCGKPTVD